MANDISWQNQAFSPVKFDPSNGLAVAQGAFSDINKTLEAQKKNEADANYQDSVIANAERKQLFTEGAGDRKIAEEQRVRAEANARAQAGLAVREGVGGSYKKTFLDNPDTQKLFAGTVHEGNPESQMKVLEGMDKGLFDDVDKSYDAVYKGALANNYTDEEARALADQDRKERFQVADKDLISPLLAKPGTGMYGSGGSGAGSGSTGTNKLLSNAANEIQGKDLRDDFMVLNNIEEGSRWEFFKQRFGDWGDLDLTKKDVLSVTNDLQSSMSPGAAYFALQSVVTDPDDGTTTADIRNLNKVIDRKTGATVRDHLVNIGQKYEAQQNRTMNTKGGNGNGYSSQDEQAHFANLGRYNENLMSRTLPQEATYDARKQALMQNLGINQNAGAPAQRVMPVPQEQAAPKNITEVFNSLGGNEEAGPAASSTPQEVTEPQGNIMLRDSGPKRATGFSSIFDNIVKANTERSAKNEAAREKSSNESLKRITDTINTKGTKGLKQGTILNALQSKNILPADRKALLSILKTEF